MTESGALRRTLGPVKLALIFTNGIIGAGIFALPGLVAAALGSAAAVGYAICAALVVLIFLCFAEVGSRVHDSASGRKDLQSSRRRQPRTPAQTTRAPQTIRQVALIQHHIVRCDEVAQQLGCLRLHNRAQVLCGLPTARSLELMLRI